MELPACGHLANEGPFRTCLHLCVEEPEDVARLYTGVGGDYHLLCEACAKLDDPWSQLAVVCLACTERADEWMVTCVTGQPEVRPLDQPLQSSFHEEVVDVRPANDRCLAPLGDGWLVYTGSHLVQPDGTSYELTLPDELEEDDRFGTPGPTVHTSADGRFAAVVRDYGRYGAVVDLADGRVTLHLDRKDDDDSCTTPYPIAFLGDGTLVAATEWNRLDRFDAATGQLLTPRDLQQLDYFHGGLTVSPTGAWLLDDGWYWHPVGIPTVIDLMAWRSGQTSAAEHGRQLSVREWVWDRPVAWVSEHVVAIQGIGENVDAMLDGVELYDTCSGDRVGMVFGPKGRMWAVDGQLAVVGDEGLEVWDPVEGARVGVQAGYWPTAFNARTRTFGVVDDGVLRTYC